LGQIEYRELTAKVYSACSEDITLYTQSELIQYMHKIITPLLIVIGTVLLTSCANPIAKNEDFATVTTAHRNALLSKMIPESFTNPNGQARLSGNITAQMNTGSFQVDFTTDSKIMGMDSDTTITLSGSTNTPELGGNISMNLHLNAISKSGS
jgi:hypothetical protein